MAHDSIDTVQDLHHPLILSSRVTGTPVYDRSGNKLGSVDDLSIEKKTGKTVYAILSFGGFLGIGERYHPVPWMLLDYDTEQGGYTVPLTPEALKDAPNYDGAEIRLLGGADHRSYGNTIYGYYGTYGVVPYW
jgi:hypothetical protein